MPDKNPKPGLDDILTEKELLDLLGIKKSALDSLRLDAELPFCQVSRYQRVYFVEDLLNWLKTRRKVIVQGP
jgi:hypothetical protein